MVVRLQRVLIPLALVSLLAIGLGIILSNNSPKDFEISTSEQQGSNVPKAEGPNRADFSPESKGSRLNSNENQSNEPNRSSPEMAFNTLVTYLSEGDFRGYLKSFSEEGILKMSEGRTLSDEEIEAMNDQFRSAGFSGVRVISRSLSEKNGTAQVVGEIESVRGAVTRRELWTVSFEEVAGRWIATNFDTEPLGLDE